MNQPAHGLALLLMLMLSGCHLLLPFHTEDSPSGVVDSRRWDSWPSSEARLDSRRWDSLGCAEDQGISQSQPQNPACAVGNPPSNDVDCDGLSYDERDYPKRNQDFWPTQVNRLAILDGFTQFPSSPRWSFTGSITWECGKATVHPEASMKIDLPFEIGREYLVEIRFAYGELVGDWEIGLSAGGRTCALVKSTQSWCPKGMCYSFALAALPGKTFTNTVDQLQPVPFKKLVFQLWSLGETYGETAIEKTARGHWCRIFENGSSPDGQNLAEWLDVVPLDSITQGGALTLFAKGQDLIVDQVRVFARPGL